jgi:hypothetical protein
MNGRNLFLTDPTSEPWRPTFSALIDSIDHDEPTNAGDHPTRDSPSATSGVPAETSPSAEPVPVDGGDDRNRLRGRSPPRLPAGLVRRQAALLRLKAPRRTLTHAERHACGSDSCGSERCGCVAGACLHRCGGRVCQVRRHGEADRHFAFRLDDVEPQNHVLPHCGGVEVVVQCDLIGEDEEAVDAAVLATSDLSGEKLIVAQVVWGFLEWAGQGSNL